MKWIVEQQILAPVDIVWKAISDIENCPDYISAIKSIKVLEKPDKGLIGLKWKETRIMFGKEAAETLWITDAQENAFYETRAESHGSVYISRMSVEDKDDSATLTMSFEGYPQSLVAKIMSAIMMPFFKGSMVKAVEQDLLDIKHYIEAKL